MVQGGMSNIAEATPAAKASPRWCRDASANTNSRRAAGAGINGRSASATRRLGSDRPIGRRIRPNYRENHAAEAGLPHGVTVFLDLEG